MNFFIRGLRLNMIILPTQTKICWCERQVNMKFQVFRTWIDDRYDYLQSQPARARKGKLREFDNTN